MSISQLPRVLPPDGPCGYVHRSGPGSRWPQTVRKSEYFYLFLPRREIQKPCLKIHDGRTEALTADRPDEHVYHPTEGRVTKPQTPDRGNLLDRNKACSVRHALVGTAGEHKMLKDTLHTRRVLREPDAPPTKRAGTSRPRLPSSSTAGKLYSKRTIKLAVLVPLDEGPTTNKEATLPSLSSRPQKGQRR